MRSAVALLLIALAMSVGVALFLGPCSPGEQQASLSISAPADEVQAVFADWVLEGREVEEGGYEGRRGSVRLLLEPWGDTRSLILLRGDDAAEMRAIQRELSELLSAPTTGWQVR